MPFIGILSSFSRKGENVRNFAFLRGIFVFAHFFAFFAPKWKKSQKCVLSEKYLSVPLTKRIYIYTFSFLAAKKINFFALFRLFHFWGDLSGKSAPGRKKAQKSAFLLQKVENAFFAFWTGKHLPEPYVYKAFYALAKTVIFCVFRIFYILLEIIFTFAEKVLRVAEVFCAEKSLPKNVHLGFVFKGAHYFPAPKTDLEHFLRKVRNISEICVLG